MGREIRRVPADWEHPKISKPDWQTGQMVEDYQPLFDRPFEIEAREWMDKAIAWDQGLDSDCDKYKPTHPFYWQWAGQPPNPAYYRPKWTSEPTHYQMYETVSEGTPVTPHFATKEELIDYLVANGDNWDQKRTTEGRQKTAGWSRKNAEDFVNREYAPSMIITSSGIFTARDGIPE